MGEVIVVRDEMMRGCHVIITAERIERTGLWSIVGRVDGELHDTAKSDDPERDGTAERMLAEIDAEYH